MKKIIITAILMALNTGLWAQKVIRLNDHTAQVTLQSGQLMYLDFYGDNIFRLFEDPNGGEIRDPEAKPAAQILVDNPRRKVSMKIDGGVISTPRLTVKVDLQSGAIDANGLKISAASFMNGKTTITLDKKADEYFFGGGCQNGRFSHAGKAISIVNTNNWVDGGVASPTPFYWSTEGYGVMGYTFQPGQYDFGAKNKDQVLLSHDTDYLDYFFMFDKGAVALLNDFYQLTGNPVLLPKFGFYEGHLNAYNRDYWTEAETGHRGYGYMQFENGKTYHESQKDDGGVKESLNGEKDNYMFSARAAIDRYIKNDMPLGWFLPNDGYGAGYGQTGSLAGNIQNLKEFGDYARSNGVEIGLWTQSDLHPKEGVEPLLQRDIVREVRDAGVRVLKTDVAWVGDGYSFGLNGVADVGKIMPYYGNNARPFIISLDGWAGTQRYAGIWTGDQTGGEWEYIRFHIPTYIGCGLSGQPNVTSDMDGIFGGLNLPMNIRDFQWKTFTPMQLNMDGWGSNEKYPFALGDSAATVNRWYLKLKSRLLPYTYSIAHEAVAGKPIMRAMFLEEENPYTLGVNTQYQFMYGPSILVAPIYKVTRNEIDDVRNGIYLPQGNWIDFFTGNVYAGERILNEYDAPLWKLPVFVKQGSIIPTHKSTNNPSQMDQHLRCYDIYPAGNCAFTEYDDDGKTEAYLSGDSVTTRIESSLNEKGLLTVSVGKAKGQYNGFEANKTTQFRVYCSEKPKKIAVKVGGRKVVLTEATDYADWLSTPNSWFFGKTDIDHMDITALMVNVGEANVQQNDVVLTAQNVKVDTADKLLSRHGSLAKPAVSLAKAGAYTLTSAWDKQENADYYEVEFDGMNYSTIRDSRFELENLSPKSSYNLKVRAVNADGKSDWADLAAQTTDDPLEFAIRGIKGSTSCPSQEGQRIKHLFDFDETTTWHTQWGQKAVPFDIDIDLKSINHLDKLQYIPRADAGNGTILAGTVSVSKDKKTWSAPLDFTWAASAKMKELDLNNSKLRIENFESEDDGIRYIKMHITKGVGDFGSGMQMYIFRLPGSEYTIPGDINQDKKLDENDLTSYYNYTGLRRGDGDFGGYVEKGDLNKNGLIDVYDISAVATELEGGVTSKKIDAVSGQISMKVSQAGDDVYVTVSGKNMKSVNGLSMCIPYDATKLEYKDVDYKNIDTMYNMTNDRLHSNGTKALYPTFVNIGYNDYCEGTKDLFILHFKAKNGARITTLKYTDGMLIDKDMNTQKF